MASSTAPIVAAGLVGGYATARFTKKRPLGGVVLLTAGGLAAKRWVAELGIPTAVALGAVYVGAFGASHPLAKKVGAWPSVALVTAVASGAAALAEARSRR
ncbi:MAG: hypothetical protein KDB02_10530 [Acidimicrobiales bacterium]|nr:hypothetical protein [Acidimicrobiales bacterium]